MAETKFTDEDISSLNELSQKYQTLQASFGQIRVQKILLNQQQDGLEEAEVKLEADYIDTQSRERELVKELNEKYGPGTLDPETGIFTSQESASDKEGDSDEESE